MSRHRNVRNLTEDDYYDDYYDDDDYYYEDDDEQDDQVQQQEHGYYGYNNRQSQGSEHAQVQPPQQLQHHAVTEPPKQLSLTEKQARLTEMGFTNAQAKTALGECNGNLERATNLLVQTTTAAQTSSHAIMFDRTPPPTTTTTTTRRELPSASVAVAVAPPTSMPATVKTATMSSDNNNNKTSATNTTSMSHGQDATVPKVTVPKKLPPALLAKIHAQKSQLSMVVLGHVDAGKSTLMGQLLFQLGHVPKRTITKYHKQATELGKASFALAWVMDEDESERQRGVTMDVATKYMDTTHHKITLLDAPGHADFVPSMIAGAASAQVGILVVAATRGEFEAGFGTSVRNVGGQTREHVVLARGLGVSQLIVAVNKLDAVDWSEARFEEIRAKLEPFLLASGFPAKRITFVPTSGLTGVNVKEKPNGQVKLSEWYHGPTLLEAIDAFQPAQRNVEKPLRIIITDVYMEGKSVLAKCRVVQGVVQMGDRLMVLPIGDETAVSRIGVQAQDFAMAGDTVDIALANIDLARVTPGCILSHVALPLRPAVRKRMKAKMLVMEQLQVPIIRGAQVLLHMHSIDVPAVVSKLIATTKRDGSIQKERPRVVTGGASALVEITLQEKVCLESFADCRALGRFVLRRGGDSIAVGIIEEVM